VLLFSEEAVEGQLKSWPLFLAVFCECKKAIAELAMLAVAQAEKPFQRVQ
jgi:hypothetical protein